MAGFIGIIGGPMRCESWVVQSGFWAGQPAGKTGFLLDVLHLADSEGTNALAIQNQMNVRDGMTQLRDKRGRNHWATSVIDTAIVTAVLRAKADIVCIDEAHFWSPQHLLTAAETLRERGVCVWIAGIDIDHTGERFPWWQMISRVADTAVTFAGQCYDFHAPATHTFRYHLDEGKTRAGEDEYESMCKDCFEVGLRYRRERFRVIHGIIPSRVSETLGMAIGGGYGG